MSKILSIESVPDHPDFRRLRDIAAIRVDLRYASPNNFVGDDMYSPHHCGLAAPQCGRIAAEGDGHP